MPTTEYDDVGALVDEIVDRLDGDIVVGAPLGLGKANHVLNELVARAIENRDIDLTIWSALTLSKPDWDSELERRLVEPLADRIFGDYPELEYARLLCDGELPANIEVHQFYYPPGKHLCNPDAQQNHHSVNYTHVLRANQQADLNLLLQLVGVGEIEGERYFNLGSNTDISADLIEQNGDGSSGDGDIMVVGQVNRNMPFMYGDGPVPADRFDAVLDDEQYEFPLFGPPNMPISDTDYAIALRVSALLRDGGSLQIGIGSLGDAIGHATELRHHDTEAYRDVIDALGVVEDAPTLVEEYGGLDAFDDGLYAATEMFVEAFLHLYESGVLRREVYDDPDIQRLVDQGHLGDGIDAASLDALVETGAIPTILDEDAVAYLKRWGLFRSEVTLADGELHVDGRSIPADLSESDAREAIAEHALGDSLDGGTVLHAAFFLGSNDFYEGVREMDDDRRRRISMKSVKFTNQLYGDEELKRRQRSDARFINTGMKATVTGGIASDGLANNQVVSGVGGQFNFVEMGQELDDGRSIIMIRATHQGSDGVESNIVWNYGHITVPRHMRDIVVTEYGIADLRDKCDAEVIQEMIKIADSRFQDDLVERAKSEGKLPEDWEVPEGYRNNYPETVADRLAPFRDRDLLPEFPYGTDFTSEERDLTEALRNLESSFEDFPPEISDADSIRKAVTVPEAAQPYLERMDLDRAWTPREFLYKRAVVFALAESEFI
ncbi:acetyl-CoA hydrolase/transferase C-terminal domain-containing protein [Halorientalis salina]|uniref:acetyl-CoA hydrolase/transferase C-terminal domain-containing protein n=1 Tax=Halorientalis salina TaxID=2932266 RepID=UPI0010AC38A8|nr:acetyl-CoA hydrolase/transferase C-terminal domain-containing protein [Halorientalis salina]